MALQKRDYDAVVVGSGPNGLASAILMQQQGLSVLLIEGKDTIGGGMRSAELTLPGFTHDICSAVHPLAMASPFFKKLPLQNFGLKYLQPELAAAHPLDSGNAAVLYQSVKQTAAQFGLDEEEYFDSLQGIVNDWPKLIDDVLAPLRIPDNPVALAKFGLKGITSATHFIKRFKYDEARAFFGGMAAHSMQPLSNAATSAIGLVLLATGHTSGWPVPKGGSQSIANALTNYFISIGGQVQTGNYISNLSQLPSAHAVMFDITPKQLLQIAGHKFSPIYKWQLERYRYGSGVFKMDWALDGSIPFTNDNCRKAETVHIGNTFEEIADAEGRTFKGQIVDKPFVLLAQPSIADSTRAPEGKQSVWGYCHAPAGSTVDMTVQIENQIERFAPGFKERILARHTFNSVQIEEYNHNYIGGDINGGVIDIGQLFTRPALRLSPYRTSAKGLYICSSSTPPGGGVHGMCGYHAAKRALKDVFHIKVE